MNLKGESSTVDYSIVIPVYYNEGSLEKTMQALQQKVVDANPGRSGEIIFVDDGSGDGSLAELLRLRERYPDCIKIIKFTRNFGQVNALLAGFAYARGKCVVALSADGQDPPELINQMLDEFFRAGVEVVICARQGRDESYMRILASKLFYALMKKLSFPQMPAGGFDYFLLGRRALEKLLDNREAHPFLQGQILWTGFKPKIFYYRRREREIGVSRWSFGKKLTYLLDGVLSYSFVPIRLMSILGALIALSGFIYAVVIIFVKLIWGLPVQGWAPLMVVLLVISGIQLLMLGVIGEYLWRTLAQARNRDPYVIEAVYD